MDLNHTRLPIPPPGHFFNSTHAAVLISHVVHGTTPNIHELWNFANGFLKIFAIFFDFFCFLPIFA